ncbi:MAG: GNAT family N-acetyltransferase [Pseudomonadota bacterium]
MAEEIHIIQADWHEHQTTLQNIRRLVFIEEQNVPQSEEWDGQDEGSTHFLAVSEFGHYVGCARLLPSGQIGRMAVIDEVRGRGIGAMLLEAAVEAARQSGIERVFLHAQGYAEDFYRKGGFVSFGAKFMEAGIEHISMEMMLPIAFEPSPSTAGPIKPIVREEPPSAQLPEGEPLSFQGLEQLQASLESITSLARRKIDLLHPNLDQDIFEHPTFVDALSHLARSAPLVEIRILLMDSKLVVDRGHQILELARRLDNKIKIRLHNERITDETSAFLCADMTGFWVLPQWREPQGICDQNNRVTTMRLKDTFTQAWERSVEDPQLRVLNL